VLLPPFCAILKRLTLFLSSTPGVPVVLLAESVSLFLVKSAASLLAMSIRLLLLGERLRPATFDIWQLNLMEGESIALVPIVAYRVTR